MPRSMNVLFVCHNGFTCNSMSHITGFARGLRAQGHVCTVAIPDIYAESRAALGENPPFRPALFSDGWRRTDQLFLNGQLADVIHAWTPREHVRQAVERCREAMPAADLVIHLEDNEAHLNEAFAGMSALSLGRLSRSELAQQLPANLSHPRKHLDFLGSADGVTGIIAQLAEFVPAGVPFIELWPAVDFDVFHPGPPDLALRHSLEIGPQEKIICYTGNSHFANGSEMQTLYEAVFLLNRRGIPCRLIRTGLDDESFPSRFSPDDLANFVLHLGLVESSRLPGLLRLADVLVQPGGVNAFNRHRLPSKLPEFLASGRPVVLPSTNLGLRLRPGEEALMLATDRPEEIADLCQRVFADAALAQRLSDGAAAFARREFDLTANSAKLAQFYQDSCLLWCRSRPREQSTPALAAN